MAFFALGKKMRQVYVESQKQIVRREKQKTEEHKNKLGDISKRINFND